MPGRFKAFRERAAVILRLGADTELPSREGPWPLQDLLPNTELAKGLDTLRARPLYNKTALDRLTGPAQKLDREYRPAQWDRYVFCRIRRSDIPLLDKLLSDSDEVRFFQTAPEVAPPPSLLQLPADTSIASYGWLRDAPLGVGAQSLWQSATGSGFTGGGSRILLVEHGCNMGAHPDIDWTRVHLHPGSVARNQNASPSEREHGLHSLGVLVAQPDGPNPANDAERPLGLAHGADEVVVFATGGAPTTANATQAFDLITTLTEAITAAKAGDILLLELQTIFAGTTTDGVVLGGSYAPLEVWEVFANLIRLATALQVVVVEPAGNGLDLWDVIPNVPGSVDFNAVDSGAIMVAAGQRNPVGQWVVETESNHGGRIDCFAPGRSVLTTDAGQLQYTSYGDTSAASAIVAAAAAVVQGAKYSSTGKLSPTQLRALLHGTGTTPKAGEPIGTMPNLNAILMNVTTTPDVVIRDRVGDDGSPQTGLLWRSPDIVVRAATEPPPTGPAAGPTPPLQGGTAHKIWCFAHNRGGAPTQGVSATVWFAPPSLLLTPSAWNLIGSVSFPTLFPGTTPTQSTALSWPADQVPSSGHYCFIAQLDATGDAASSLPDIAAVSIGDWPTFVGNDNNLAWRNFNAVSAPARTPTTLPFFARGAERENRKYTIDITTNLPPGTCLEWAHGGRMITRAAFGKRAGAIRRKRRHDLNHRGGCIGPAVIRAQQCLPMSLCVTVPDHDKPASYVVVARQCYRGREVGRVTWVVRVPGACG